MRCVRVCGFFQVDVCVYIYVDMYITVRVYENMVLYMLFFLFLYIPRYLHVNVSKYTRTESKHGARHWANTREPTPWHSGTWYSPPGVLMPLLTRAHFLAPPLVSGGYRRILH